MSPRALSVALRKIRERGYEEIADESLKGIIDISYPICDQHGHALAALTLPFVHTSTDAADLATTRQRLAKTAFLITGEIGGRMPYAPTHMEAGQV